MKVTVLDDEDNELLRWQGYAKTITDALALAQDERDRQRRRERDSEWRTLRGT